MEFWRMLSKSIDVNYLRSFDKLRMSGWRRTGASHSKLAEAEAPDKHRMAPRAGLEPATQRLTVVCSTN